MIYLTQRLDHAHPITASVTLPIDVRVKSRARVALNDGREAGLMLPRLGSRLSAARSWHRRDAVLKVGLALGMAVLFGLFFFWSRTQLPQ